MNLNLRVRKSCVPSELFGSSVATLPSHKCGALNLVPVEPCSKYGQSESPSPVASSHLASSSSTSDAKIETCLDFPRENASESNDIRVEIDVECALSAHESHEPVHLPEALPASTTANVPDLSAALADVPNLSAALADVPDLSAALVPTKSRVRIA